MKIDIFTPDATILMELGKRLARLRKQQGYSQTALAEEAGLGVATLRRIEAGKDSQMESWLKIMKSLNMTSSIDALLPENFASPKAETLAQRKKPRASNTQDIKHIKWGDELE